MEYIPSTKCPWNLLETKLRQNPSARYPWNISGPRFPLPSTFQMRSSASESRDRRGDVWTMVRVCRIMLIWLSIVLSHVCLRVDSMMPKARRFLNVVSSTCIQPRSCGLSRSPESSRRLSKGSQPPRGLSKRLRH